MQCLSYSTLAGEEFLHHALNLLTEASLIEIESEYILAGIEILQARVPCSFHIYYIMYKFKNELSCRNIFMQCLSYSTLAGEEFLHHALNLLTVAILIEIETEHILAGIVILQARVVLISLAYLQRSYAWPTSRGATMACSSATNGSEDGSTGFRLSSNALR